MKTLLLVTLMVSLPSHASWREPALLCPEASLPQERPCLDLTRVVNPLLDFPAELSSAETEEWSKSWSKDLKVCRAREVLRRSNETVGSFTPLQVQISWMTSEGAKEAKAKLAAITAAATKHQMPVHVLIGALTQESLLANLGVSADGGNYSCGIGQLNLSEWCLGMQSLPLVERQKYGWPSGLSCEDGTLSAALVAPFYQIALQRLGGRPLYRLEAKDFNGISYEAVVDQFPSAEAAIQEKRFHAVSSFIAHCQDHRLGIAFKARNIKNLYDRFVPASLKNAELNPPEEIPVTSCQVQASSRHYPLHTGWLLALAAYNAGPSVIKLLEHYYQRPASEYVGLTPHALIEALYWGGKIAPGNERVRFQDMRGRAYSQTWYKSCVVQRHIARVIQHVTQPGLVLARSLEEAPCSKNPPAAREASSGVKL